MKHLKRWSIVASLGLLTVLSPAVMGGNANPGAAPIKSSPHGKSYGEWAQAWWTWASSIPADQNPVLDTTGEFASVGQSGHVWFLAGTIFGGTFERDVTVPTGTSLFFPALNALFWAPEFEHAAVSAQDLVHERRELRQWLAGVPAPLPAGTPEP